MDLDAAERLLRAFVADLSVEHPAAASRAIAEYDRRGAYVTELARQLRSWSDLAEERRAALAERDAEVARLRAAVVEHLTVLTELPGLEDAPVSRLVTELNALSPALVRALAAAPAPAEDEERAACTCDSRADLLPGDGHAAACPLYRAAPAPAREQADPADEGGDRA